jgi:hypothetical protein
MELIARSADRFVWWQILDESTQTPQRGRSALSYPRPTVPRLRIEIGQGETTPDFTPAILDGVLDDLTGYEINLEFVKMRV